MSENMTIITKNADGQTIGEFTPETYRAAGLEHLIDDVRAVQSYTVRYVSSASAAKLIAAAQALTVAEYLPELHNANSQERAESVPEGRRLYTAVQIDRAKRRLTFGWRKEEADFLKSIPENERARVSRAIENLNIKY